MPERLLFGFKDCGYVVRLLFTKQLDEHVCEDVNRLGDLAVRSC